ncbi:hypothetical protein ACFVYT_33985 [Streptomyces sp. NPDC058290]|uniref:hypothetical protein n=1 Tax=Streptomyces sp. NPDC058290 TaxID=3346426 RepID=UPI0036E6B8CA
MAVVKVDSLGNGQLSFKTFAGDGWSTSVVCTSRPHPRRQMEGSTEIASTTEPGSVDTVAFSVKRT